MQRLSEVALIHRHFVRLVLHRCSTANPRHSFVPLVQHSEAGWNWLNPSRSRSLGREEVARLPPVRTPLPNGARFLLPVQRRLQEWSSAVTSRRPVVLPLLPRSIVANRSRSWKL